MNVVNVAVHQINVVYVKKKKKSLKQPKAQIINPKKNQIVVKTFMIVYMIVVVYQ